MGWHKVQVEADGVKASADAKTIDGVIIRIECLEEIKPGTPLYIDGKKFRTAKVEQPHEAWVAEVLPVESGKSTMPKKRRLKGDKEDGES